MPRYYTRPLTPREQQEQVKLRLVREGETCRPCNDAAEQLPRADHEPPPVGYEPRPVNRDAYLAAIEADRQLMSHLAALHANGIVTTNEMRAMGERPPLVLPPGMQYRRMVVAKPPVAEWRAEGETKQARQVETLLLSWCDRNNRPVVEPWMELRAGTPCQSPDELPVNLRPEDAGTYWQFGNEVYMWIGGFYRTVTLPQMDAQYPPQAALAHSAAPAKVLTTDKPMDDDTRREVARAWGGESVAAQQPPPVEPPGRYPVRPVAWIGECPRCGEVRVHWMRLPKANDLAALDEAVTQEVNRLDQRPGALTDRLDQLINEHVKAQRDADPVDAEVIRECRECGQEWGEK